MRVVVTSGAGAGHVGPLLPIVAALHGRGDEVAVVVPEGAADVARRTGAEVVVSPAPPAAELADAWERFRLAPPAEASRIANGEIFGRLDTVAALPVVERLVADRLPDVVLHEAANYAGVVAAVRHGVAHVQVAISLAGAEAGSLRIASAELEAIEPGVTSLIENSPYLTRFPDVLDPSTYPVTRRYRASVVAPRAASGDGNPLVYVTFGTVASSVGGDSAVPYRAVLTALDGLDVRVLVTTGRGHRPDLGPSGTAVRVEEWVDQDEVLAAAAVVVCHGGSGTVLGALAHGVPVVVLPLFADQPANAKRIAAAGAGLVVERVRTSATAAVAVGADEVTALRRAVERALADPSLRDSAERIGAAMRAAPDPVTALDGLLGRS